MPERLRDLFDLPDQVVKGEFVVDLHREISRPEDTIGSYVATPRLVNSLDEALGLIGKAVTTGKSLAAHVHGSFGAGKSHFLAVLDLLITNNLTAWNKDEFHPLRDKHGWVGGAKPLVLPVHCTNARRLEDRVFSDYLAFVRKEYPDAPPPALFRDTPLFELANVQRRKMPRFFEDLNQGAEAPTGGFAELLGGSRWDERRFEAAIHSTDPDERKALFDALLATHYPTWAQNADHFVDFNEGLQAISRHAKELSYGVVVLLLDELILWLATFKANPEALDKEIQKVSDLVKEDKVPRAVPIVTLIARQKALKDLLGEEQVGGVWQSIDYQLDFWKERFNTIDLESRDLPLIIKKRVLKPKDGAKAAIDKAFVEAKRAVPADAWRALVGDAEGTAFRDLYPFSPAVIDTLVALSNVLQRKRSVLRILTDLLVEHVGDQPIGSIVPLGDLFDVVAQEELKDAVLEERLRNARKIYEGTLLELIRTRHQTGTAARCQRLRDDHPAVLGCSGCPERQCRNDNRIAKSLLLAGLVPHTPVLRDMTPAKLNRLNHGVIRAPVEGDEAISILQTVRRWAEAIGLRIDGQGDNPTLQLHLFGIDVNPYLEQAANAKVNTEGACQRVLREILYEELGLDPTQRDLVKTIRWRGTQRRGDVVFGNVRLLSDEDLRHGDNAWKIVVDFPWDGPNYTPEHDRQTVERFCAEDQAWTIVWLPSFFSADMRKRLDRLVCAEHVLKQAEGQQDPLRDLTPAQREAALEQLRSMRDQLRLRVRDALHVAYGVRPTGDMPEALDPDFAVAQHTYPLNRTCKPVAFRGDGLHSALDELTDALLSARFPGHPCYESPIGKVACDRVAAVVARAARGGGGRVTLTDARELEAIRDIGVPLELVELHDQIVNLQRGLIDGLRRKLVERGEQRPTVATFERLLDEDRRRGLDPYGRDLVIACYALQNDAAVAQPDGRPYESVPFGKLPADAFVMPYDLPSADHWATALEVAGPWGTRLVGRGVTAANVEALRKEVEDKLRGRWARAGDLQTRLDALWSRWGDGTDAPRLATARSAAALVRSLSTLGARATVEALATTTFATSATAVIKSLEATQDVLRSLDERDDQTFVNARDTGQADALLVQLRDALRTDELNAPLADTWRTLGREADGIVAAALRQRAPSVPVPGPFKTAPTPTPGGAPSPLVPPAPTPVPPPGGNPVASPGPTGEVVAEGIRELDAVLERVKREAGKSLGKGDRLVVTWRIERRGGAS